MKATTIQEQFKQEADEALAKNYESELSDHYMENTPPNRIVWEAYLAGLRAGRAEQAKAAKCTCPPWDTHSGPCPTRKRR